MSGSTEGTKTVLSIAGLSYGYSSLATAPKSAASAAGQVNGLTVGSVAGQSNAPPAHGLTIRDLGLTVNEGEIVCILGASGCGKSTLLNLIAGLLQPDTGKIDIKADGENHRRIGYIFQQDALLPWRTVEANLMLAADLSPDVSKEAAAESVNQYLQTFKLSEQILKQYPAALSGGMRQRVSIIQSLMFNPTLLLLDEPFSALDFFTKLKLEGEFYQLIKEKNKAAILVTHDIEESVAMADRILLMGQDGTFTKEFVIDLGEDKRSPETARGTARFADYYRDIWSELKAVIGQ
jgi:NitT/TauT family transport system ATP-binding protein